MFLSKNCLSLGLFQPDMFKEQFSQLFLKICNVFKLSWSQKLLFLLRGASNYIVSFSPSMRVKDMPFNSPFFPPEQHFPFHCPPTGDTCWGPCSDSPAFPELCSLRTKTFSFSPTVGSLCSISPKIQSPTICWRDGCSLSYKEKARLASLTHQQGRTVLQQ